MLLQWQNSVLYLQPWSQWTITVFIPLPFISSHTNQHKSYKAPCLSFDLDNPHTSSVGNSLNKPIPKPMETNGNHSIDFVFFGSGPHHRLWDYIQLWITLKIWEELLSSLESSWNLCSNTLIQLESRNFQCSVFTPILNMSLPDMQHNWSTTMIVRHLAPSWSEKGCLGMVRQESLQHLPLASTVICPKFSCNLREKVKYIFKHNCISAK